MRFENKPWAYVGCILILFCACGDKSVPKAADIPSPVLPGNTVVSASLDVAHRAGQNLIWCNTFQLAWNSLGNDFCGEPLRLEGTPQFERALNAATTSVKDVDAASVYIKTGKVTPELIEEINVTLKKQFGDDRPTPLTNPGPGVLAYAYLVKNLMFAMPFEKQSEPFAWRGTHAADLRLQTFGIMKVNSQTPKEMMQQIMILEDKKHDYIIELKSTSREDRLILAMAEPKATLKDTLAAVRERVAKSKREPVAIQVSDQCLIPYMQLNLERVYDEIIKKDVLNEKLKGFFIADARQTIRFNLDEKGATLKSESKIYATKNGHAPRTINFNRPFLLYMERAGAEQPYLAIWFENSNLFVKHAAAAKPATENPHETPKN